MSSKAMIVAAQPEASEAGARVLMAGGNAVDAANLKPCHEPRPWLIVLRWPLPGPARAVATCHPPLCYS